MNNTLSNTASIGMWNEPDLVDVRQLDDSVEFIYIETSMVTFTVHPPLPPERRVFKQIFDGKGWSAPIYGEIVPAVEESYEFDGEVEQPGTYPCPKCGVNVFHGHQPGGTCWNCGHKF